MVTNIQKGVFSEYPDVLNVKQISELLCICEKTTYNLIAQKELPVIRIGRQFRITKFNLMEYMQLLPHNNDICG